MADTISSMLGSDGDTWSASENDAKRQAIASLRGYAYQLHQSLAAWIALADDATLHLEISEDYAEIARDPTTLEAVLEATQIKDTRESGSVTLNSADVLDAIRNYWFLRDANAGRATRLVFLTTSPIGRERRNPLSDGSAGLKAWALASRGGAITPLRTALQARLAPLKDAKGNSVDDAGLSNFLHSSDDDELRKSLLTPIRWTCGAPGIESIEADNRSALVVLGQKMGGTPELSGRAADILLVKVLTAILDGGDRRLRRGQLLEELHRAITVRVPAQQALGGPTVQSRGLDLEATGAWRVVAPIAGRHSVRANAVNELRTALSGSGSAWLHGATGMGKSILAELAALGFGGSWRLLDLRGTTGPVARERLVAARTALLGDPSIAGLIIDDVSPHLERDIEGPSAALAETMGRREIPLITTSNQLPSQRFGRALGIGEHGILAALPFDSDDASALVSAYGGDPAKWSWFALVVAGAHPQLVDVVVSGLERRGWPDTAMTDWMSAGLKNEDVEAEREATRRRLLAELAPDTMSLLARTSRIYGSFDRALGVAVGAVTPVLSSPGLALDQLAGQWIERLGAGRMRSSPLVSGLDREVLDETSLTSLDLAIVTHILTRKTVDADLFDTAFFHALLARDESWINWMVQHVLQTSDEDRPKLASAVPMMRAADADADLYAERPLGGLLLRLAQHLLKTSIGTAEDVATSSKSLLQHLERYEAGEESFHGSVIVLMKLLFDAFAFGKIPGWFEQLRRFALLVSEDSSLREILEQATVTERDPAGFIFIAHAARLPSIVALEVLFSELDRLPKEQRERWIDAMHNPPLALSMIVDNAWLKQSQLETMDGVTQAAIFGRLADMALSWGQDKLAGHCFRAQAIMLDEYARDRQAAESALDQAADRLPGNYSIERARAKVAWRADDHGRALSLLLALEDRIAENPEFDGVFALREAAMSSGELGEWDQAARLFEKARAFAVAGSEGGQKPLATGLGADAAAALFMAGDRAGGARAMARIVDELSSIDAEHGLSERSVHLVTRHLILWMRSQNTRILVDNEAPHFVAGAASNPNPKPAIANLPLSTIAPAWMMLGRVALDAGIPVDEVLAWPGMAAARQDPDLEVMVRFDLLNHAIEHQSIDEFRKFLMPAIEASAYMVRHNLIARPYDPTRSRSGQIESLEEAEIASASVRGYARDAAIAFGLNFIATPAESASGLEAIRAPVETLFKYDLLPEWSPSGAFDGDDRSSLVAHYLGALGNGEVFSVEKLFVAHLRMLEWAKACNHRDVALKGLAGMVRRDWTDIVAKRKSLLISPTQNVPEIEAALSAQASDAAFVAGVLLAAAPAVSVNLSQSFRALLSELRNE